MELYSLLTEIPLPAVNHYTIFVVYMCTLAVIYEKLKPASATALHGMNGPF